MYKSKFTLIGLFACCFSLSVHSQTASFATWKDNKRAAYTIIHDDFGNYVVSIYNTAYPLARDRGVKFCFGAITNNCGTTEWQQARTMIADGFECVNHSHNHRCGGPASQCTGSPTYGTANYPTELGLSTQLIETNTNVRPLFFIHPYDTWTQSVLDYLKNTLGYLGSRAGTSGGINASNYTNFMNTAFFGFDNSASAISSLKNALDQTITQGGYLMREFHGIADQSFGAISRNNYIAHLDYVKSKIADGSVWSATASEVITYRLQRDAYTLSTNYNATTGTVNVNFTTVNALNTAQLKTPITVNVNLGSITGTATATQGTTTVPTTQIGAIVSFNVYPHQGNVVLKMSTTPPPPPPTGAFDPTLCYRLNARHTGKPMSLNSLSTANNIAVVQNTWSGGRDQVWRIKQVDATYYYFTNGFSGKAAAILNASTTNGATLVQSTYANTTNQHFQFVKNTEGYYTLTARHSSRVLDVFGGYTTDKTAVIQWNSNGDANQQWLIESVGCPTGTVALTVARVVAFNGYLNGDKGTLQWVVNSEDFKDYFEIEKQTETGEFKRLDIVNGNSTNVVRLFNFTDAGLDAGENIYRLKSTDAKGQVEISDLVTIKFRKADLYAVSPNPTSEVLNVNLSACENQAVDMDIVNLVGLKMQHISIEKAGKTHQIDVTNLTAGQYLLHIQPKGKRTSTRVFVKME